MTALNTRNLRALALGLAATTWTAGTKADVMTTPTAATTAAAAPMLTYGTVGSVDTPAGGAPNLVYFQGTNGTVPDSGSIDLGHFVVSALAKTTGGTYTNTPFQEIVYSGGDQSEKIAGVLNGSFGPSATNPSLTATVTSVSGFGNNALPFKLNIPMNMPMKIDISDGVSPATTTLSAAVSPAAPIPEPASIALFAVAFGGVGFWHRRRAAR